MIFSQGARVLGCNPLRRIFLLRFFLVIPACFSPVGRGKWRKLITRKNVDIRIAKVEPLSPLALAMNRDWPL